MQSNGNEEYFTEVYQRYYKYAIRVLTRDHSLPYQTVEDLVQGVFLNFWSAITEGRFDKKRDPKPFIAAVTNCQIAKYFQKNNWREYINRKGVLTRKIRPRFSSIDKVGSMEGTIDTPLEGIIAEEERETTKMILGYLESLPPTIGKECLIAHIQGKTYGEIALELRISTGSVSAHISNIRKKLREKFAKELQELYED